MPVEPSAAAFLVDELLRIWHQQRDSQRQPQYERLAATEHRRELVGMKSVQADQTPNHGEGMLHGGTAEEYPRKGNGKERHQPSCQGRHLHRLTTISDPPLQRVPGVVDYQIGSVKESPQDKGPCRSVP